ncbi:hypothetical protein PUNSTDRAFT_51651 [Punctularia strigosozonata HHB-11173 SS5]|uniref:uncharacterized protein n=1 Tax=Punctularia strigosozonata (strain HHB-11173) TaxID=741275 RepID=UPI000441870B|nr:uncharacterized protein PUNSTDRAFT_51651 [Punctularia strigosozonata HHB-11173 SS5]EIN11120.1 hypothetical protein PUNSTDRAFT_51651 [Punctularia strigosozonata HHB-11173 SS5]
MTGNGSTNLTLECRIRFLPLIRSFGKISQELGLPLRTSEQQAVPAGSSPCARRSSYANIRPTVASCSSSYVQRQWRRPQEMSHDGTGVFLLPIASSDAVDWRGIANVLNRLRTGRSRGVYLCAIDRDYELARNLPYRRICRMIVRWTISTLMLAGTRIPEGCRNVDPCKQRRIPGTVEDSFDDKHVHRGDVSRSA